MHSRVLLRQHKFEPGARIFASKYECTNTTKNHSLQTLHWKLSEPPVGVRTPLERISFDAHVLQAGPSMMVGWLYLGSTAKLSISSICGRNRLADGTAMRICTLRTCNSGKSDKKCSILFIQKTMIHCNILLMRYETRKHGTYLIASEIIGFSNMYVVFVLIVCKVYEEHSYRRLGNWTTTYFVPMLVGNYTNSISWGLRLMLAALRACVDSEHILLPPVLIHICARFIAFSMT